MMSTISPPEGAAEVVLDGVNVRGLAHPLRVKMLGLLRQHGPATATGLAAELGESSGATSYHLRQLADYGFIVEAPKSGSGRQRWWQAAHRSTSFDFSHDAEPDVQLLGLEYLRGVANYNCAAIGDWVARLSEQPQQWRDAGTVSDWQLILTPARSLELQAELIATIERFQGQGDPTETDQANVTVQLQVLPQLSQGAAS
ncbi:MAG: winged helix-turn-helix domain-containing protein [Candidatus Nanopelagicales bacterium]